MVGEIKFVSSEDACGYIQEDLNPGLQEIVLKNPRSLFDYSVRDFKKEKKVRVSLIKYQEKEYILKHFYVSSFRFRLRRLLLPSLAYKVWKKYTIFANHGIATPLLLAAVDGGKRIFYNGTTCLYEYVVPDKDNRKLQEEFAVREKRRKTIWHTASLLSQMHRKGILHGDAKITNFLWLENSTKVNIHVIDLDDVKFVKELTEKQRLSDLSNLTFSLVWFKNNDAAIPRLCLDAYLKDDESWCRNKDDFLKKLELQVVKKLERRRKWHKKIGILHGSSSS